MNPSEILQWLLVAAMLGLVVVIWSFASVAFKSAKDARKLHNVKSSRGVNTHDKGAR